ncbi:uncharacterized protein LOC113369862 [Ctenocephalides felis]|uniref:uncharacterized protein LOC113369862 n=1 Tax=Ctenocephalides felis TaxID=7515 RepID=UPI000E6E4163|nr:uncharacterized protein LOC113369862 [Ctenocephalides felis]
MDIILSDCDEYVNMSRKRASRLRILSSSSDEEDFCVNSEVDDCFTDNDNLVSKSINESVDDEWQGIGEKASTIIEYSGNEEFLHEGIECDDAFASYKLFFADHILDIIIEETNKYATQCLTNSSSCNRMHRQPWQYVTRDEMNTFIGILLIMGIVQLPEI